MKTNEKWIIEVDPKLEKYSGMPVNQAEHDALCEIIKRDKDQIEEFMLRQGIKPLEATVHQDEQSISTVGKLKE